MTVRFLVALLFSVPSFAFALSAQENADEIIRTAKLESKACFLFVDHTAVQFRTEQWGKALRKMPKDYVLKWITGQTKPPKLASREARTQRDCLIDRVVNDAAEGALIIDHAGVAATTRGMKKLKKKKTKKVARSLIRSHYRGASTQSSIWRRKFLFSGRAFNVVSDRSAKRCGLKAGGVWRPNSKKHKKCWRKMETQDREKEILLASSAPGISRHHWGTDFDIFGLNPRAFRNGAKLYDEYQWMDKNAIQLGMVQPYTSDSQVGELGYMEERWHWSYAPIAAALLEYAREHESELHDVIIAQWDKMSKRWGKKRGPYFDFVRQNWRAFVFNVAKTRND